MCKVNRLLVDDEKTAKGLEVFDTLTRREIEICHMIAEGYTSARQYDSQQCHLLRLTPKYVYSVKR